MPRASRPGISRDPTLRLPATLTVPAKPIRVRPPNRTSPATVLSSLAEAAETLPSAESRRRSPSTPTRKESPLTMGSGRSAERSSSMLLSERRPETVPR